MPFIYIYTVNDFVGGLPDESGSSAAGSAPFTLELVPGATPTLVEITDDDASFDELDTQTFTNTVTVDGITFSAGQGIHAAYDLVNTGTGHYVTAFTTLANGGFQGPVSGLVSNQPLIGGQSYTFNLERSSNNNEQLFSNSVACFASGAMIETSKGPRAIEDLVAGDLVVTRDHGLQPIRWIGARHVTAAELSRSPALKPIQFSKGTFGASEDLLVSPEHRMLVSTPVQQLLLGLEEALVPAKALVDGEKVKRVTPAEGVVYHHMLFDRHEIVFANGTASESFQPSARSQAGLDAAAREELVALFPEMSDPEGAIMALAAPLIANVEATLLKHR